MAEVEGRISEEDVHQLYLDMAMARKQALIDGLAIRHKLSKEQAESKLRELRHTHKLYRVEPSPRPDEVWYKWANNEVEWALCSPLFDKEDAIPQ
jgi:hypothetical protein